MGGKEEKPVKKVEFTLKKCDIYIMNQQDLDFNYFLENMDDLYKKHGQKFVAVKNQKILGIYDNFNEAIESTLKTEELGTFIIQECFDNVEKMVHHFQGNVMPVCA